MDALDPEPLLRFLHERGVEHILIGGVAVAAHGYRRPSYDVDIVPAPSEENLARLGEALRRIHARPAEVGDFAAAEVPADATRAEGLALGGNFRLETDLGALDVMQWIEGIDGDELYAELDRDALTFWLDDVPVRYCGLTHLRAMKRAAGCPLTLTTSGSFPRSRTNCAHLFGCARAFRGRTTRVPMLVGKRHKYRTH